MAHRYSRDAVQQQIDRENRRARGRNRISKREAKLIHALLKGRQKEDS